MDFYVRNVANNFAQISSVYVDTITLDLSNLGVPIFTVFHSAFWLHVTIQ